MDWKMLGIVFATVFVAELGDKTQLATLLFAADKEVSKWLVFIGASLALIATSALGVLGGSVISQYVSERALNIIAGTGFILIGLWRLLIFHFFLIDFFILLQNSNNIDDAQNNQSQRPHPLPGEIPPWEHSKMVRVDPRKTESPAANE